VTDERLIELESRLMHQEKLLEQLDEVVTEQQKRIDVLERTLARLQEQVRMQAEDHPSEPPPPHY
jgi:SlyX protein